MANSTIGTYQPKDTLMRILLMILYLSLFLINKPLRVKCGTSNNNQGDIS